jgi:hypothetical protein
MQSFMLKLADAGKSGSVHNQVFVYRKVLTEVFRLGHDAGLHDAGLHDAGRDDFVRSEIERAAKEKETGDA